MGTVYMDIILKNTIDTGLVQRGLIMEKEVHAVQVRALVDTGMRTLVINKAMQEELGLTVEDVRHMKLADGNREICQRTKPVEVYWQEDFTVCQPLAVPGAQDVLLGTLPLQDMDLVVDSILKALVGTHGEEVICRV